MLEVDISDPETKASFVNMFEAALREALCKDENFKRKFPNADPTTFRLKRKEDLFFSQGKNGELEIDGAVVT